MGFTHVTVGISAAREGPTREIELLVDTGAFYSIIPRTTLSELGVAATFRSRLRLANGSVIEREGGDVFVHYPGRRIMPTSVVFGEPGDEPVLGVHTLEGLGLQIDPRSGTIREMDTIPLIGAVPA